MHFIRRVVSLQRPNMQLAGGQRATATPQAPSILSHWVSHRFSRATAAVLLAAVGVQRLSRSMSDQSVFEEMALLDKARLMRYALDWKRLPARGEGEAARNVILQSTGRHIFCS